MSENPGDGPFGDEAASNHLQMLLDKGMPLEILIIGVLRASRTAIDGLCDAIASHPELTTKQSWNLIAMQTALANSIDVLTSDDRFTALKIDPEQLHRLFPDSEGPDA